MSKFTNIISNVTHKIPDALSDILTYVGIFFGAIFFLAIFLISSIFIGIVIYVVTKFLTFVFDLPILNLILEPELFSESIGSIAWLIFCCIIGGVISFFSFRKV